MKRLPLPPELQALLDEFVQWLHVQGYQPSTAYQYRLGVQNGLRAVLYPDLAGPPLGYFREAGWQVFQVFQLNWMKQNPTKQWPAPMLNPSELGTASPTAAPAVVNPPTWLGVVPGAVAWAAFWLADWCSNPLSRPDMTAAVLRSMDPTIRAWERTGWPGKRLSALVWANICWKNRGKDKPPYLCYTPSTNENVATADFQGLTVPMLSVLWRWGKWTEDDAKDRWKQKQMPMFPNKPGAFTPFTPKQLEWAIKQGGPFARTPPPDDF